MGRNEGFSSLIVFIYDRTLSDYLLISKASDFVVQSREYEIIYNSLIQKKFQLCFIGYIRTNEDSNNGWPF